MKKLFTLVLCIAMTGAAINAQTLSTPPSGNNQKCAVKQYIGAVANVTVKYSSPDVDGRQGQIWGTLVPYGLTDLGFGLRHPSPWRAGANENTTIHFSHDVVINGKPLAAGNYGLHLIVAEEGPWTWIFSNNTSAWGSFFYRVSEDALRVETTPVDSDFTEWLTYAFTDRQPAETTLELKWENKSIPMQIALPDVHGLYASTFDKELQGAVGFTHTNWAAAANYMANNDYDLNKALEYANAAISAPFVGVTDWTTLQTKANVLTKMGKEDEAHETMMAAVEHPATTAFQIHGYGRTLIGQGRADEALKLFEYNYEKFDSAWPTNVGMARGLSAVGRYDEALKYAQMAAEEAPDQLNKDSMNAAVEKLKQKQDIN